MAELKLDGLSSAPDTGSPRELALVREACTFLEANPEVASSLSIVVRVDQYWPPVLAAMAERIAEEYGLQATVDRTGGSLVLAIARQGAAAT